MRDPAGTCPGRWAAVLALHGCGTEGLFHAVRGLTCGCRSGGNGGGGILGLDSQATAGFHPRAHHVLVTAAGPDEGSQELLPGEFRPVQDAGERGAWQRVPRGIGLALQLPVAEPRPQT